MYSAFFSEQLKTTTLIHHVNVLPVLNVHYLTIKSRISVNKITSVGMKDGMKGRVGSNNANYIIITIIIITK